LFQVIKRLSSPPRAGLLLIAPGNASFPAGQRAEESRDPGKAGGIIHP